MLEVLTPSRAARLLLAAMRNLGDAPGHEFHGNQWTEHGELSKEYRASKGTNAETNKSLVANVGVAIVAPEHLTDTMHEAVAHVVEDKHLALAMKGRTVVVKQSLGGKSLKTDESRLHGQSAGKKLYLDQGSVEKHGPGFTAGIIRHELEHSILTEKGRPSGKQEERVRYSAGIWAALKFSTMATTNPKAASGLEKAAKLQGIKMRGAEARLETPVHAAADKHRDKITVAVRFAFAMGRKQLPDAVKAAEAVRHALLEVLPSALLRTLVAGGNAAFSLLPQRRAAAAHKVAPHVMMRFDAHNADAERWAREHAVELATSISETTRDRIREAVANQELTGQDAEDAIAAAVGDDVRAELIARTESMAAANEGQRESWDQAVEAGLLPDDARKVWVAAANACPECDELDGEEVGLDEEYPNDGGDGPPLHPNCRCTEGIVA